jgi:hypothetical protein
MDLGMKIVFSEVGGFSEQLSSYPRKVSCLPALPDSLAFGIQKAIDGDYDPTITVRTNSLSFLLCEIATTGKVI